jgi:hypothetical protein
VKCLHLLVPLHHQPCDHLTQRKIGRHWQAATPGVHGTPDAWHALQAYVISHCSTQRLTIGWDMDREAHLTES